MKEHIIINKDRTVVVPDSVRKIGIQYDHKVNTLTFDCPRYADDNQSIDLSRMAIYINFSRNDKTKGSIAATNVFVDPDDPEIMHFDFIITRSVTLVNGPIICLVCAKSTDAEGVEVNHWNSELFNKLSIGEGMEAEEELTEEEIDYITSLLQEINTTHAEVADIDTRVKDLEFNQEKQGVVSEVDLDAMTWTDGSYITGSGTIGSSSGYGISELVTLPKMSTLILDATGYQSDVAMIAKSDHTPLVTSVDGKTHYEYYTDEEIQVYISCKTTAAKSAKIVRNVAETLSDLERENSELKGDLVDFKSDLNLEKGSVNLLDEESIDFNNKIITIEGTLSNDDRGFRVYVLDVGVGNTVTVSIDQNWFYGIQADGNSINSSNSIKDVDTTTYFDSSKQNTKTEKTVTMTHRYLWLCFIHKNADSSFHLYTSTIMVNIGDSPLPYEPYNLSIKININNDKYESLLDLSVFEQAYINNCELVANYITPENNAVAQYTGAKMTGKVINVRAKVKFYGSAFCTFISEPNGLYSVTDVIDKSVHINMSRSICYVGYFDGRTLTNTKVINYSVDEGVEITVGFNIDISTDTITVYLPNGETYTETNAKYTECAGEYAMWEHYKGDVSSGFVCNHFTKIYAKDENGKILCDDFKRKDGSIGISPQGYIYGQFTSLNQTNWVL